MIREQLIKVLSPATVDFLIGPGPNGRALARAEFEQKSLSGPLFPFWPDWPGVLGLAPADREDVSGVAAYAGAALAYICMNYRAQKLAEAPVMVVEEADEGDEWLHDHELAPLLADPNADQTMDQLYELTNLYRDATGGCLWLKVQDRGKRVAELRAFPKSDFTVTSTPERLHGEFKVRTQQGEKVYSWRDVIYFVNPSITDPVNGATAPLEVVLAYLNIGGSVRVQARNLIKNAVRPTGAFTTDQRLSDDQFARLREQMRAQHQGASNAGDWMLVEGGAEWKQISQTLGDVIPDSLISWIEGTVCAAFQLHPALLGIKSGMENSPWSHLETATRNLYDQMCLPQWSKDAKLVTKSLLRDIDDDPAHLVRFDTSAIPALQEDLTEKLAAFKDILHLLTGNEIRQMAGLAPLPGVEGDIRYVPIGLLPSDMLGAVEAEGADDGEEEPDLG